MLLAGDIGGTKTLLGLFDGSPVRPRPMLVRSFGTLEYRDLPSMVDTLCLTGEIGWARLSTPAGGFADTPTLSTGCPGSRDHHPLSVRLALRWPPSSSG